MSKTRGINLLDANGDVKTSALDNVPATDEVTVSASAPSIHQRETCGTIQQMKF